ncbi:MAG TPA: hypothetical protein VGE76_16490, partial [Opitutaceae bacterium]
VRGSEVRWRFVDFEPKGTDHDIALTYIHPEAMKVFATLRRDFEKAPECSRAAVKLAKHLLAVGRAKSNSGFPPYRLTTKEYEAILGIIADEKDKRAFAARYYEKADNLHEEKESEWTESRLTQLQILADAGYRDEGSRLPSILEGERLLKDTLAREPNNAEAWNVYLSNYWRFSFAAVGHWFGATRLSKTQATLIETAAANCPEDETIGLWLALRRNLTDERTRRKLDEAIERHGWRKTEFPEIKYKYY